MIQVIVAEQLRFLHEGTDRTIGQAAIQYILDSWPCVTSVLPNIYDAEQLKEFAEAPDTPSLTDGEIVRVNALYESNFGLPRAQEAATVPSSVAQGPSPEPGAAVGARHASPGEPSR